MKTHNRSKKKHALMVAYLLGILVTFPLSGQILVGSPLSLQSLVFHHHSDSPSHYFQVIVGIGDINIDAICLAAPTSNLILLIPQNLSHSSLTITNGHIHSSSVWIDEEIKKLRGKTLDVYSLLMETSEALGVRQIQRHFDHSSPMFYKASQQPHDPDRSFNFQGEGAILVMIAFLMLQNMMIVKGC